VDGIVSLLMGTVAVAGSLSTGGSGWLPRMDVHQVGFEAGPVTVALGGVLAGMILLGQAGVQIIRGFEGGLLVDRVVFCLSVAFPPAYSRTLRVGADRGRRTTRGDGSRPRP
jgi:hypothetical protein